MHNEQCCGNCRFFRGEEYCCYFPPINNTWPAVKFSEWCGQWSPMPVPMEPSMAEGGK